MILNPAPACELPAQLFALVNVLIPNETETALLSGYKSKTGEDLHKAAKILLTCGVESVVITLEKGEPCSPIKNMMALRYLPL